MNVNKFFDNWMETPLGQAVLEEEQLALNTYMPKLSGDYFLILGSISQLPPIAKNSHRKRFLVSEKKLSKPPKSGLEICVGKYQELPIATQTIDTVLLPHTLDLHDNSLLKPILKDVTRTLTAKSQLIIIGVNPLSLWGAIYLIKTTLFRQSVPWAKHLYFPHQIEKHLTEFNFSKTKKIRLLYRPPIKNLPLFKTLKWLEFLGKNLFFLFNGVYILIAERDTEGWIPSAEQKIYPIFGRSEYNRA